MNWKINWTPENILTLVISLIVFFTFLTILIKIFIIILSTTRKTNKFTKLMPAFRSEAYIDIKSKKIFITEYRTAKDIKEFEYEIDDFIYMLSINPDSMRFRELCKIIRNGATKARIKSSLKAIPSIFMYIVDYNDGRRSIAYNIINSDQDVDDKIYFQMTNAELLPEEKSEIKKDLFDSSLAPSTDSEIFSLITKEAKRLVSKGVTLFKISPKHEFVESNKDYLLNAIQLIGYKKILIELGIKVYTSIDGSIFGITSNDRKKTHYTIQKAWVKDIHSEFEKSKKLGLEYANTNYKEYNINTFKTQAKDSFSLNEALIFLNLAAYSMKYTGSYNYDEVIHKANDIAVSSELIIKQIKDKKNIIKSNKNNIEERGIKPFHEVFLDFPKEMFDPVIRYSYRDKKEIIDYIITAANKQATKVKTENVGINIDLFSLTEVISILKTNKIKSNVYIYINESEKVNHLKYVLSGVSDTFKKNGIKVVQYIQHENGANINIFRIFKPEFVMLVKGLNDSTVLSDKFKLNLKNIENIKDKEQKIINIK